MKQVVNITGALIGWLLFCEFCCNSCLEVDGSKQSCTVASYCRIQLAKLHPIVDTGPHEARQRLSRKGSPDDIRSSHHMGNTQPVSISLDNARRVTESVNHSKSDAEILLQFKKEISDPLNALQDWKMGKNVCFWTGVLCRNNSESVVSLNLTARNLKGAILPELGELKSLSVLDLSYNEFSGGIPASLGNCILLKILFLQANRLSGILPRQLGLLSNLVILNAESNMLNGSDSLKILANCFSLRELSLGNNQLVGFIPRVISKLTLLSVLRIHHNQFTSNLPSQIGHLTELQSLLLNNNLLNGSIPRSIGYLRKLQTFDLDSNLISGTIPYTIFRCSNLTELRLGNNMLNGVISSSIGQLQQLTVLQLDSNLLTGSVPSTLGNCIKLQNVNLSHNKLDGKIPASISKDENLTSLDLSINNFSGEIPPGLANLTRISFLNFSENNLIGQIPDSGIFLNLTPASFLGNPLLCGKILQRPACQLADTPSPAKMSPSHRRHHHVVLIAVASAGGTFAILSALVCWYYIRTCKYKKRSKQLAEEIAFFQRMSKATAEVVKDATQNYEVSNLAGIGHSSSVYRGILSDGTIVAVKLLDPNKCVDETTFFKECRMLKKLRHKNIVSIYSFLFHLDTKALVLPFLFGGTLHKRLHDPDRQRHLSWASRLKIAIDVADALYYLHFARTEAVVHAGLRPSNILLDDDMVAQVSDFGMYRLLKRDALSEFDLLPDLREYEAPEYADSQRNTLAGDVYSFGVVLLEMVTGRNPTSDVYADGNLRRWVRIALHEKSPMQVIDKVLLESDNCSIDMPIMAGVLKLAVHCTEPAPQNRPTIKDVLALLMQIHTYREIRLRTSSRAVFPLSSPDSPKSLKSRRFFISHSL
ncbi:hypothetical protein O6H91_03G069500 [Diphasiastrum complanatum]|uniref:Uncharacterized protein n=3 Tax=Diphasiastrum complanatum TaxID=34168 RepID=A0ACC2E7U6_DIPCM|nr:hypothetical protein O6H91_03G069500 [Diphasiastrum complanatum]KAJ7562452.1 hypothetical protein O6H91_03G069500 [Diphasiastrum complanatum]KAJ7562453.1 hypothetical protein O6H91_03G069500 [Diphasiastrum complanatum]